MRLRALDLGAVTLSVAESGSGGWPLLLVHGFGGAKEDFTDFLDDLAALGWHAVAPDLRGHGDSDKPDVEDAYSFEIFAADLLALADALDWDRFVVLGHSMGGMSVLHLVLDHPERVAALILMDTSPAAPDDVDPALAELAVAVLREHGVQAFHELTKQLADPLSSPAYQRLLRERPDYQEFCDRKALGASGAMRISMYPRFVNQPDRLSQLAGIAVPTLVVVGEQDDAFIKHADRMAATIPGARLAVIPDAGHSPQFENTAAWWAALTSFLEGLAHG
ncbi:MAG: putative hydrolase or acyltransferase of alpha/beta superfamily [Acidimicrobiales bacterium]|jgi:3-oxoadipate enol-lactonase|nr:putative hydrolase or acyltransferase of alpha/beta superfamily [Acidimicrobiales bacterium]